MCHYFKCSNLQFSLEKLKSYDSKNGSKRISSFIKKINFLPTFFYSFKSKSFKYTIRTSIWPKHLNLAELHVFSDRWDPNFSFIGIVYILWNSFSIQLKKPQNRVQMHIVTMNTYIRSPQRQGNSFIVTVEISKHMSPDFLGLSVVSACHRSCLFMSSRQS